jgi:P27 family predicted phage terminase small subunit
MRVHVKRVRLPPGMDERARAEFRRIKPLLLECGYSLIDEPALVAYLTHWSLFQRGRDEVAATPIVETPNGQLQSNPWHVVMRQNSDLMKKWIQELGFSPGARKRLKMELGESPTDDADELFGG